MSKFNFNLSQQSPSGTPRGIRSAFSTWILRNYGDRYREVLRANRARLNADRFTAEIAGCSAGNPTSEPLVGIVGGGFAGLFAGLILQSLGIECEVFENTDRVGGRIFTWYSTEYDSKDPDKAGLYGEVGGMRVPQFSEDMLPVQQLALAVNAVLERNGLHDQAVIWRKFYYNSPQQRLRYNNMQAPILAESAALNYLNFGQSSGGDVPDVWLTPVTRKDSNGNEETYLPINMVLDQVNQPFLEAINQSFAQGFDLMMQYDQYSMWDYLTTVFTLGDLGDYYDPAMGAKCDLLPWSVASYLETTNVGTGMYGVSFVEMVIAVYDWGGSVDPYLPSDNNIYMITVNQGMQRLPDACRTVLDLQCGVTSEDGNTAQVKVGMLPGPDGGYSYTAKNLTPDAYPPGQTPPADAGATAATAPNGSAALSPQKQRVFLGKKVVSLKYDPALYDGHGGMNVVVENQNQPDQRITKQYPFVITTLPNGAYLNGEFGTNLLNDISLAKAQAIREVAYMPAFKAFLTFKEQFWATLGERQGAAPKEGLGVGSSDRPNRQIVYPSYGYDGKPGVLQVYCWAQDAERLGALSNNERIAECLKGIQYLYPEVDVLALFAGIDDGVTTRTWFWDNNAGGGAFALFNPGQYKNLYPTLQTPEFGGCLNFAGEACSVHHGWIVGALDSAYNAVRNILLQTGNVNSLREMEKTWGVFTAPDVATNPVTVNEMSYANEYNLDDRRASSPPTEGGKSIYGDSDYTFVGDIPAFIADYSKVPQSMKKTNQDVLVLDMLNDQWDDNVALRRDSGGPTKPLSGDAPAVKQLEHIYYGRNFQTIAAPPFWLKDDDEFARQQLAGFMPTLLTKISPQQLAELVEREGITGLNPQAAVSYIADYRQYLKVCTVIPEGYYLPKPIVLFAVDERGVLMPRAIQLEAGHGLFTPDMPNAENAWLLAKMLTNCAGQTLHDVGFHQLYTHQICAMVSISLFSEEVFNPLYGGSYTFQQHPVFKLLSPHVVKTTEFQQTIYNREYNPYWKGFPATRAPQASPGVYNIGFVYDLIFSCGRIGNYQLQDKMYNEDGKFRFLDLAVSRDAARRDVLDTPFSYAYVHDTNLWLEAIYAFVLDFVAVTYPRGDAEVAGDVQLQRFFDKLIPAFNHKLDGTQASRFPASVKTVATLVDVLTMFIWQFSVQHSVVNDGAYNQAAFVPNASTLMYAPPNRPPAEWTPTDVLACLPSQTAVYPSLGNMSFMDVQINASVTGQGPYPETMLGRGVLQPSIDVIQDTYDFADARYRAVVERFFQGIRRVGEAIALRQARDIARYMALNPQATAVPETVVFRLVEPERVMNTIQT